MTSVHGEKEEEMSNYKEGAVLNVSKECFYYTKEDSGFKEYIVKRLSSELAERIMGILEQEKEIVVVQSDLRVSEFIPTNSVEYRRQINWSPLVRCKDCVYWNATEKVCVDMMTADENGFCSWGEREDGKTN